MNKAEFLIRAKALNITPDAVVEKATYFSGNTDIAVYVGEYRMTFHKTGKAADAMVEKFTRWLRDATTQPQAEVKELPAAEPVIETVDVADEATTTEVETMSNENVDVADVAETSVKPASFRVRAFGVLSAQVEASQGIEGEFIDLLKNVKKNSSDIAWFINALILQKSPMAKKLVDLLEKNTLLNMKQCSASDLTLIRGEIEGSDLADKEELLSRVEKVKKDLKTVCAELATADGEEKKRRTAFLKALVAGKPVSVRMGARMDSEGNTEQVFAQCDTSRRSITALLAEIDFHQRSFRITKGQASAARREELKATPAANEEQPQAKPAPTPAPVPEQQSAPVEVAQSTPPTKASIIKPKEEAARKVVQCLLNNEEARKALSDLAGVSAEDIQQLAAYLAAAQKASQKASTALSLVG